MVYLFWYRCFHDKQFYSCINLCYMMCQVAKTLRDCQLTFKTFGLLGCLLLHVGFHNDAKNLFVLIRDIAVDNHNWCVVMQSYEWIGRCYQELHDYDQSTFAFKLMMQYSWINQASEFEIKSYAYLARQNFYMQYVSKANDYYNRALRGIIENQNSCNQRIAHETFKSKRISEQKVDKFVRNGYDVSTDASGENTIINMTEDYNAAHQLMKSFDQG